MPKKAPPTRKSGKAKEIIYGSCQNKVLVVNSCFTKKLLVSLGIGNIVFLNIDFEWLCGQSALHSNTK